MTTVLLCHGFIQNARAFDVPGASIVCALEEAGYRPRTIEMRGRDGRERAAGFSVYVGDAAAIVEDAANDGERVVWLGHSMGGLIGAALPDRARAHLAALVTIGAPMLPGPPRLHGRRFGRSLVAWARTMHALGRSFPGRPYGRAFSRARRLAETRAPLPIRLWKPGSMEREQLDAMLHDTFAHDSFAVFADLLDLVESGGRRAGSIDMHERIASMTTPLCVVAGHDDELAPAATARLLHERAGSAHKELVTVDAGHVDLLAGRAAQIQVWQPVLAFLERALRPGDAPVTPRAGRAK